MIWSFTLRTIIKPHIWDSSIMQKMVGKEERYYEHKFNQDQMNCCKNLMLTKVWWWILSGYIYQHREKMVNCSDLKHLKNFRAFWMVRLTNYPNNFTKIVDFRKQERHRLASTCGKKKGKTRAIVADHAYIKSSQSNFHRNWCKKSTRK